MPGESAGPRRGAPEVTDRPVAGAGVAAAGVAAAGVAAPSTAAKVPKRPVMLGAVVPGVVTVGAPTTPGGAPPGAAAPSSPVAAGSSRFGVELPPRILAALTLAMKDAARDLTSRLKTRVGTFDASITRAVRSLASSSSSAQAASILGTSSSAPERSSMYLLTLRAVPAAVAFGLLTRPFHHSRSLLSESPSKEAATFDAMEARACSPCSTAMPSVSMLARTTACRDEIRALLRASSPAGKLRLPSSSLAAAGRGPAAAASSAASAASGVAESAPAGSGVAGRGFGVACARRRAWAGVRGIKTG